MKNQPYFSVGLKICFTLSVIMYSIIGIPVAIAILKKSPDQATTGYLILGVLYFIYSLIAPAIALEKNRSGLGFLMLAFFLNPLIGIAIALIISPLKPTLIYEDC